MFYSSTLPVLNAGVYTQCNFQLIPNCLANPWLTWEMKEGPLSDESTLGMPNLGKFSSNIFFATALLVTF